ncbi:MULTISPECIES: hypothetical protein [Cyanophyceae]|uniref:hypothetical protein n=1 Tax=Cyanophyceae TaxID=3028117 RepID=UPI0023304FD9|nr:MULTISPECIES: hypothetical protein [Cyanophyceae]MDB9355461.1 hypothetical protein [Nodularia spumigena CS-587/03]MDB9323962.1 hypothetical protein [Nodularia spumigena CS-591/07A]MDB9332463.1 hypothetical protein [Nodularia spumigena CS-591/04]MDB9341340.1 hypothetical protein [Nodularia spumigena CS-589/07]MDB9361303.1 hypothetical protein [Nodularia spumigena CS-588/02]
MTSVTEISTSKNQGKDKNSDEHLTSPTKHKVSENQAAQDTSVPQYPNIKRLLNEETQNFFEHVSDRISQAGIILPLASIIREKASLHSFAWPWQAESSLIPPNY